jgi:hypothetical protein
VAPNRYWSVREDARPSAKHSAPKAKLSQYEQMHIFDRISQPDFANLTPTVIVPILADRKLLLGTEIMIYRMTTEIIQLAYRGNERLTSRISSQAVAFRIVVVNYAAILFILGSFRPLSVTEFMCVHFLSSPDQRFGFAFLAAA